MNYKDILDTIVVDSGDAGASYRANAYRWLNFVRQDCVSRGDWKSSKNSEATLVTDVSNTTGIYSLDGYDEVIGGEFYDLDAHNPVMHDSENKLMRMGVGLDQVGPPVLWADAGMTALGEKQVRLWPIPEDVRTLAFLGRKVLIDVDSSMENVTLDAYFGPLSSVGTMLMAGMRYYHDLNNNEDVATVGRSQGTFYKIIAAVSGQSGVDANSVTRMEPVNRRPAWVYPGRLDPGHFSNR